MDMLNSFGQPRHLPSAIKARIEREVKYGLFMVYATAGHKNINPLLVHTTIAATALQIHPLSKGKYPALYGLHTGVWEMDGADLPLSHRFAPPVIQ